MRFYKNLKDDLHCFQATLLMVLSIYFPKKKYTYSQIDKITGYQKGKYTQDAQGLLWLAKKGFQLIRITDFDEKRFIKEGESYLKWYWKPEVYERNKRDGNIEKLHKLSQALLPYTTSLIKIPTVTDIDHLLTKGNTVIAHINPHTVNGRKRYANHTVLVLKVTQNHVYFHNPGIPPRMNQKVSKSRFQKALHEVVGVYKHIQKGETR